MSNIEHVKKHELTIPFKIVSIKERGFVVKVAGLYAFVHFSHMPWRYPHIQIWEVMFPYLKEKSFFCNIYEIRKDSTIVSIIVNGKVHKFEPVDFMTMGSEFNGIIVKKADYGIFVEIGYSFDWEYGSILGLVLNQDYTSLATPELFEVGKPIKVRFIEKKDNNKIVFSTNEFYTDFYGELYPYIGQNIDVMVIKNEENKLSFLAKGKYPATLSLGITHFSSKKEKRKAKKELKNGDIIFCKLTNIFPATKSVSVAWDESFLLGTQESMDTEKK